MPRDVPATNSLFMERIRRLGMRATWFVRPYPDVVIIGAMKSGTSSVYDYLTQHPKIRGATRKEVHYLDMHFDRGGRWYRAQFPARFHASAWLAVEATPMYLSWPYSAERFSQVSGDARFVVLLRDPVDRAASQWKQRTREGRESRTLLEVAQEESRLGEGDVLRRAQAGIGPFARLILAHGHYAEQLERWFHHFDPSRFMILDSEEFFVEPASTVASMHEFLSLESVPLTDARPRNVGDGRAVDDAAMEFLADYYEPFNARLSDLLGKEFNWRRGSSGHPAS